MRLCEKGSYSREFGKKWSWHQLRAKENFAFSLLKNGYYAILRNVFIAQEAVESVTFLLN